MSIGFYQVFVTPLKTATVYGSEVEITDFVISGGVSNVSQSIDSGGYDIGLYTYADLTLNLVNYDGRFNDDTFSSSMFYFTRDRAKVRVKYTDQSGDDSIVFNGIINDEATTQDFEKGTIKIRVLSRDSILRKTKVAGGLINNGNTALVALNALLNRPSVTNVMGYNSAKISVGYNAVIDNAVPFSDKDTRTVLELLMNASGSVFYIDDENDMVVSPRTVASGTDYVRDDDGSLLLDDDGSPMLESIVTPLALYGGGDPLQQDNIITIKNFNTGLQRTFNTITVNNQTASDDDYVDRYGVSIKAYTFDFITNPLTAASIAEYILGQFKAPKNELEVIVPTEIAKEAVILDLVTVNFKYRYKGFGENRVPLAGNTVAGSEYAPYIIGGIRLNPNKNWKIIGITHAPKDFLTTLRLREI